MADIIGEHTYLYIFILLLNFCVCTLVNDLILDISGFLV